MVAALVVLVFSTASARTIRVGVYDNPPMVFQDQSGKITGFYPYLLEYIAQKEGWKIEYRWDTFTNHLQSLSENTIDLLVGIAHSPERAQNFDFNQEAVWLSWGMVYTHPSISIQSFLDLNGKKIFVVTDDIYHKNLRDMVTGFGLDCQFVETEDYHQVLQKAQEERGIGVVSRTFGLLFGPSFNLKPSPLVFSPVSLRVATLKGKNREILDTLDRWLSTLKEDPQSAYHQAVHEFLEVHTPWTMPRWVYTALTLVLGVAAVLLTFTVLLRHQVVRKTKELLEKNRVLQEEVDHRLRAEARLSLQVQVERLLTQVSTHLFRSESLDAAAQSALEKVGNFLGVEYLLVQFPQRRYLFINPTGERGEPEPLVPKLITIPPIRKIWEKEGEICFSDWEKVGFEGKKALLFARAFRLREEEGFLEGMVSKEYEAHQELLHHLPLITHYLGALFEYLLVVKQRREQERWFMVTLKSLGDAVITTDPQGRVTFLNPVAQSLTGWSQEEAQGKPVEEVFRIVNEETGEPVENPVRRVLQSGMVAGLANHTLLIRRNGEKIA
ncbi:MAG: transporter substrate-binding domain-containing protein, partial [Atribacterota bacterium]